MVSRLKIINHSNSLLQGLKENFERDGFLGRIEVLEKNMKRIGENISYLNQYSLK